MNLWSSNIIILCKVIGFLFTYVAELHALRCLSSKHEPRLQSDEYTKYRSAKILPTTCPPVCFLQVFNTVLYIIRVSCKNQHKNRNAHFFQLAPRNVDNLHSFLSYHQFLSKASKIGLTFWYILLRKIFTVSHFRDYSLILQDNNYI